MVVIGISTGISQGIQPLISKAHGLKKDFVISKVMKYAIITTVGLVGLTYLIIFINTDWIVRMFNSDNSIEIASIAKSGLRIYFIGLFFAGINIISSSFLSAIENPRSAFIISIGRGLVVIIPAVIIFSIILKMTGVWLSFVFTEVLVFIVAMAIVRRYSLEKTSTIEIKETF